MHARADTGTRLAALALAWIAGVALQLQQRVLWPVEVYVLAFGLGALGAVVAWRWRRAFVLGLIGALLLAIGAAARSHLLVFDAGPQYSRESDAGQRVLLPLLRARGEARIDRLVLSHRDLDHVGGAGALLKAMPVDDLLSSLELEHPLLAQASHTTRCQVGQSWAWDGVRFEVLRPLADDYLRTLKSNAMSCVLRVSGGHRSVLLTGDIEREQEAALLAALPEALRSDVLIVPHHGSKTSSTGAFLDAVQPRVAVFQAGYRNRFGHPAPEVLARYRERVIEIDVTPSCGAWLWLARTPAEGACYRENARRYWHHGVAYPD